MSYEEYKKAIRQWRLKHPPRSAKALVEEYNIHYMSHREFMERFKGLLDKIYSPYKRKKFIETIVRRLLDLVDLED